MWENMWKEYELCGRTFTCEEQAIEFAKTVEVDTMRVHVFTGYGQDNCTYWGYSYVKIA